MKINVIKKHLKIKDDKIKFMDHSFGHANFAFFSRNYNSKSSLVLTLDAFGDNINYSSRIYSVKKGLLNSSGTHIIFQDADLEYNPADLLKFHTMMYL